MKKVYIDDMQIHDYQNNGLGIFLDPEMKGFEIAEIRLPSFPRPNSDGAIAPNQLYNARLISISGVVHADSINTYEQHRRDLNSAVAIQRDTSRILQPLTLKFTTDDDLELQVAVFTKKFDFPRKELLFGKFRLDLFAPSFQLVGQALLNSNVFVFQGGGFAIPFAIPFAMNVSGSSISSLSNNGNDVAYPFYVIHGPAHDATFTNLTTGEDFSIAIDLAANEVLEIDTQKGTVVYRPTEAGSPTNYRQYFSGDFVTLQPGTSEVKFNTSDSSDTGYISIRYRNSYTGI